jgi:hypothetical protein
MWEQIKAKVVAFVKDKKKPVTIVGLFVLVVVVLMLVEKFG